MTGGMFEGWNSQSFQSLPVSWSQESLKWPTFGMVPLEKHQESLETEQYLLCGWATTMHQYSQSQKFLVIWNQATFKVPDNLSHFSRHDLAHFEARSSKLLYMSHGVITQLGSKSKSRSAKFLSLTLTLMSFPYWEPSGQPHACAWLVAKYTPPKKKLLVYSTWIKN